MPSPYGFSRSIAAGLLIGGAAGLLAVAARRIGRDRVDELLDWDQVNSIALKTSGGPTEMSPSFREQTEADYQTNLAEFAEPLGNYTGTMLSLSENAVKVVNRPEWIDINVANFREMLSPFEQLYRETTQPKLV